MGFRDTENTHYVKHKLILHNSYRRCSNRYRNYIHNNIRPLELEILISRKLLNRKRATLLGEPQPLQIFVCSSQLLRKNLTVKKSCCPSVPLKKSTSTSLYIIFRKQIAYRHQNNFHLINISIAKFLTFQLIYPFPLVLVVGLGGKYSCISFSYISLTEFPLKVALLLCCIFTSF